MPTDCVILKVEVDVQTEKLGESNAVKVFDCYTRNRESDSAKLEAIFESGNAGAVDVGDALLSIGTLKETRRQNIIVFLACGLAAKQFVDQLALFDFFTPAPE